ncbi:GNAT family N-acetyltransferase [Actinophytocola oryzae]|uniref:RimJ/RimL family protein N-acetyltransferase n=1 Tax=Actinophytocola oryzae TaxID=502181 RepID=A0A4R7W0Z9_9PSEU|nr:GNAT family N-acetyltransferase [Actinophytocola oryzae]TDV55197.1 RimJ/RimL family protein N-acetyltransferase [Actinophytocola oryzae]
MSDEELLTERLTLSRPTPTDIDAILAIHADPLACKHNPSDALVTREDATGLFYRWDAHWHANGFGYWVVRRRGSAVALGFCGLKYISERVLNLFYRFAPDYWGQGIATESATAVVRRATSRLPDHSVIARVRPDNVASQHVAIRAGLGRAEHLDGNGEDGLDWVYVL